ncbi:MAG: tyrosine-type recombinase/integrase [Planctomycetota bacterium]
MARIYHDKRLDYWCVDYLDARGCRKQVKAGRTKSLAESVLAKVVDGVVRAKVLGEHAIQQREFSDFMRKEYLPYSKTNKKPNSYRRDTVSAKHLVGEFGETRLTDITVKDVEKYKANRCAMVSHGSINRELACLKHLFSMAIRWGNASRNPVKDVKFFKEPPAIVRFLSDSERRRLMVFCPTHIKPVVLTALYTGMRRSEVFSLCWPDVDLDRRMIRVRYTKNNEDRSIPINSDLADVFGDLPRSIQDPRVFGHVVNFRKEWDATLLRAGIANFRFHDLRHTFASYLVMAGVDVKTVQEMLGHRSITMTMRYTHLAPAHKQSAVEKLCDMSETGEKSWAVRDRNAEYMQNQLCAVSAG